MVFQEPPRKAVDPLLTGARHGSGNQVAWAGFQPETLHTSDHVRENGSPSVGLPASVSRESDATEVGHGSLAVCFTGCLPTRSIKVHLPGYWG